jgi:hypothetical protein
LTEKTGTVIGAAQKDTARELGAKLASLKGIVWVGARLTPLYPSPLFHALIVYYRSEVSNYWSMRNALTYTVCSGSSAGLPSPASMQLPITNGPAGISTMFVGTRRARLNR